MLTDLGSKNGLVRGHQRHESLLLTPGSEPVEIGRASLFLDEIATSDGELGLVLDCAPASGLNISSRETETARYRPSLGSATAAIRLVRKIESETSSTQREPQQILQQALATMGAESLLIAGYREGELAITACAGCWLAEDELDRLERLVLDNLAEPRLPPSERLADGGTLLLTGSSTHFLAARLSGGSKASPSWRAELLDYLLEKVQEPVDDAERTHKVAVKTTLCLPEGTVVGPSPAAQALLQDLRTAASSHLDILLSGETGTGKEVFASAIHLSSRPRGSYVVVNCSAIPADLLEAELFGVAPRAATGVDSRPGHFVEADGGTLVLDEIGDLDSRLQPKLLRAIQEREVMPIGGRHPRPVDLRIIAATNRNLSQRVQQGLFRADLYYRLRGIEINLPPLRQRRMDIPQLTTALALRAAKAAEKRIAGLSRRALEQLCAHSWPGNVRELKTEIERAILACPNGALLDSSHFSFCAELVTPLPTEPRDAPSLPNEKAGGLTRAKSPFSTLQEQVDQLKIERIKEALRLARGNKSEAARRLGCTRNGLIGMLKRLEIEDP